MEKPSAASNYIIRPLAKAWIPIVHLIHRRTVLVLAFLFAVGVLILLWQQYMLQSRLVESALLHDAARYSRVITEFRTLYTAKVVEVVRPHGIEVTHDTEGKENAIPLPVTLSIELGNRITEKESGSHVRLYSPYPFPWRIETGGLKDDFARDAWNFFQVNPDTSFFRFEEIERRPSLRFATADLMRPSCVNCHNTHPESPKTDWKVHDVRGILEIAIPVDTFIAERRSGIRRTFFLIGGMSFLGLATIVVVKSRLRREKKRLRQLGSIVEQTADLVLVTDKDGIVEYVNPAFTEFTGYEPEEIIGKKPNILKSGEHDQEFYEKLWEPILAGRSFHGEIINKKKNGQLYIEEKTITPLKDSGGRITHFVSTAKDITERKQAEEEIRILSEFPEKNPNPVLKLNKNGDILYYNNGVLNYVDRTENIKKLLPKDYLKVVIKTLDSGVGTEIVHSYKKHYINFLFHPITEEIVHVYGLDITERKKAEEALKKEHELLTQTNKNLKKAHEQETALRQHLVNAERMVSLGDMAAQIAHEINNPLTVIKGQAELYLRKVEEGETRDILKIILDKSSEVALLTRKYMDLGKPHEVKMQTIILNDVLHKTVDSLRSLGLLKRIEISESYVDVEFTIQADENLLEQVFRNLILNAIQSIPEGITGKINIGSKISENGKNIEAYVSDNGGGIKEEDIDKVFDRYFTTKDEAAGTGLGLMISKEIIEIMHGGEISVDSIPGKGTTFTVKIPHSKYALKKKKILIVDDDKYILDIFSEFLSSKGFLIQTSLNGEEGMKAYSEFEPDLILSDIEMPKMDGFKFYDAVKKINPDQPFIMITGAFLKPEDLEYLRKVKIPQLIKPADLEKELLKVVREQLEMSSR